MPPELGKPYTISFVGDNPMELSVGGNTREPAPEEAACIDQVTSTIREYLRAARDLLDGRLSYLKDIAPKHLVDRGNVVVICSPNGAVVRYEKGAEPRRIVGGWMAASLGVVADVASQHLVHCRVVGESDTPANPEGMEIKMWAGNPSSQAMQLMASGRIKFDVEVERPAKFPDPPLKPYCPMSVRNSMELLMHGQREGEGDSRDFIVRTPFRLPVGWNCIELFPFLDLTCWKPEFASVWAENDILGAVVAHQFREGQFQTLDPNASARQACALLLEEFRQLLDSEPSREETLQAFLRKHPKLLCPSNIGMWPKLALGARKTDFVFREANRDYLLVELERSTYDLFRADGNQTQEVTVAVGQILDWKRYIEDNLRTVQTELGLDGISSNAKGLVVIGRSRTLTAENRRKLVTMNNNQPKLHVWTYDDVYDNAKAVVENLLGPLWNPGGETKLYFPRGPIDTEQI